MSHDLTKSTDILSDSLRGSWENPNLTNLLAVASARRAAWMVSVSFLKTNVEFCFSKHINTGLSHLRKHGRNRGEKCNQLQAWRTEAGVLPE